MAANNVIGAGAGKSQVQQFHDFLISEIGNIPYATQWVLQIDRIPRALEKNLSSPEVSNLERSSWGTATRASILKRAISEGTFIDKGVCIFAQGVQTPREMIRIQDVTPNEGHQGGLLGTTVSSGRQPLEELNIGFMSTNYCFLDFIVRPWMIYTSHYGLAARLQDDPKNVKTTLQIFYYDRGGGRTSQNVRKVFRFYNAAPIRVEGIISTWDRQEAKEIYTSWTYTHYDVSTETVPQGRLIADFQAAFAGSFPATSLPLMPTGSEQFSNPTAYNLLDATKPQGGALIGGSYTGSTLAPFKLPSI